MNDPNGLTYLAQLTPKGKSAIATIAICGPNAWEIMRRVFRPRNKKPLPVEANAGNIFLGRLGLGHGDEVVLSFKSAIPLCLEIHPHGGIQVVSMLLEFLQAQGAILCKWQDFSSLIYPDPLQAMAFNLLNQATTREPSKILLDQFNGAFRAWLDAFLIFVSMNDSSSAKNHIANISPYSNMGCRLVDPWRVVLAGPTNAGKSSLMNVLAGYQRSIVSDIPGTTRDVLWLETAIEGWAVSFADTAGMRESSDPLENAGMLMGARAIEIADLVLWIQDCTVDEVPPPLHLRDKKIVMVRNKIDLESQQERMNNRESIGVSALAGAGVEELLSKIIGELVHPVPKPLQAVAFHPLLKSALDKSCDLIDKGRLAEVPELWSCFQKKSK